MARENKRPEYKIPQEDLDSLRTLESMSANGMGAASRQAYNQASERGLTATIAAALRGGSGGNAVSAAQQNFLDGQSRIALADEAARLRNIDAMLAQRRHVGEMKDKAWTINEFAPYADKAQAATAMGQAAQQGFNNSLQLLASSATTAMQGMDGRSKTKRGGNESDDGSGAGMGSTSSSIGIANTAAAGALGGNLKVYDAGSDAYRDIVDWGTIRASDRSELYKLINP